MNSMLYPGLIEELVDIVEVNDSNLVVSKNVHLNTVSKKENQASVQANKKIIFLFPTASRKKKYGRYYIFQ